MSALSYTNFVCIDGSKSRDGVGFGVVYGADLGNHIFETLPKEATVCSLHSSTPFNQGCPIYYGGF